ERRSWPAARQRTHTSRRLPARVEDGSGCGTGSSCRTLWPDEPFPVSVSVARPSSRSQCVLLFQSLPFREFPESFRWGRGPASSLPAIDLHMRSLRLDTI
ncbi:hypothetical protein T310_8636, partial [Rasamsonia emersonii CBS 393.64]